jgi:hypothetical protein
LPKGKALGQDGIPSKFFQEYYEDIEADLVIYVYEVIRTCNLIAIFNTSKICFLPRIWDYCLKIIEEKVCYKFGEFASTRKLSTFGKELCSQKQN